MLLEYSMETGAEVFVYHLSNVFGKWCRPNYNSAVATYCNNIANGLPIEVNELIYSFKESRETKS
ncbi:MAG: hypothetical protein ABFD25_03120 [Clostridiaceae bacterium]